MQARLYYGDWEREGGKIETIFEVKAQMINRICGR